MASFTKSVRFANILLRNFRKYSSGPSSGDHGVQSTNRWKQMTLYVAFPAIVLVSIHVFNEEMKHDHKQPEFIAYEHLRIRTKEFPWKDGHKSLFHNPHVNALPDGYEHAE